MKKIVLLSLINLLLLPLLLGEEMEKKNIHYNIFSENERIGTTVITFSDTLYKNKSVLHILSSTKIKIKSMFITLYSENSVESAILDHNKVLKFELYSDINDTITKINGKSQNTTIQFIREINGKSESILINETIYDYTLYDSPELLIDTVGISKTFDILNLDDISIDRTIFTFVGKEKLIISNQPVQCRVVKYDTGDTWGTRWITDDEFGLLVKEYCQTKDIDYVIEIDGIKKEE